MQVYFDQHKLPRHICQDEWKLIYSRVRELKRKAKEEVALKTQMLHHSYLRPEQKARLMDELINPPLILGPYM